VTHEAVSKARSNCLGGGYVGHTDNGEEKLKIKLSGSSTELFLPKKLKLTDL
jgi:hypothetical protein